MEVLAAFFNSGELVLAVVVVSGLYFSAGATAFLNQVAAWVVGEVTVAMEAQAVTGGCFLGGLVLGFTVRCAAQDVACRIEVELFAGVAVHCG